MLSALYEGFEQAGSATIVDIDVALDFVHRLPYACLGGKMDHGIDPVKRRGQMCSIAHVRTDKFGPRQGRWYSRNGTVNLRGKGVEDAHLMAAREQRLSQMATNESSPTGNQDVHAYHL